MSYIGYECKAPCSVCGKFTSLGEPCDCNSKCSTKAIEGSKIGSRLILATTKCAEKTTPLEELYNELGTLKWIGSDNGWDKAIEAVRTEIKKRLGK